MLGIFQKANRSLCVLSTKLKEDRFRLECVCASLEPLGGHGGGAHPWGSPFWSLCSSDIPTDFPAYPVVLEGLWQEAP